MIKLSYGSSLQNVEELAPIDQHLEKEHQEKTKVKNIEVSCSNRFAF